MCWHCDHPEATQADYFAIIQNVIERDGWFVQAVQGDRLYLPFAYTIGLTGFGLPELLVSGLSVRKEHELLNSVVHHAAVHGSGALTSGAHLQLIGWPEIEVVNLAEPSAHAVFAAAFFGDQLETHQLVYGDDRGRWPWDIGFRGRQRVLGPRTLQAA